MKCLTGLHSLVEQGRGGVGGLLAANISDLSPARWVGEREWEETSPSGDSVLKLN